MQNNKKILLETSFNVGKEAVVLSLITDAYGLLLERMFIDSSRRRQTQVLSITNLEDLQQFIEHDPYYPRFRAGFERVQERAVELFTMGKTYT